MGSQKFTNRQLMTPRMATPRGAPKPTSDVVNTPSTTPNPPGVIGNAASTLARPYETNSASGLIRKPKAVRKTQSDAASSSQLAAAQATARNSRPRSANSS